MGIAQFLNRKTKWSNLELGWVKVCMISFGVVVGLAFQSFLEQYKPIFWIIFAVLAIWLGLKWWGKMASSYR